MHRLSGVRGDRITGARARRAVGVAILLPALAILSFLDGAALAMAFNRGVAAAAGWTLGAARVLHRIPEGLVLASALVPTLGLRQTLRRTALLAASTVVGALGGRELLVHAPDRARHVIVATGIGVRLGPIDIVPIAIRSAVISHGRSRASGRPS